MKMKWAIPILLAALALACSAVARFTATDTPRPPTPSPPCPHATPEPLWVEPIPATTDQLTLTLEVSLGHGEAVTVTTESGTFTAAGPFSAFSPSEVEVTLLPATTHHLEVEGRVSRTTNAGGCSYGGYILHTTRDREGGPLEITTN